MPLIRPYPLLPKISLVLPGKFPGKAKAHLQNNVAPRIRNADPYKTPT